MKRTPVVLGGGPAPIGPKMNVRDENACRVDRGSRGEEVYNWRANRQMPYAISEPLIFGRRPTSTKGQPIEKPSADKSGYGDEL